MHYFVSFRYVTNMQRFLFPNVTKWQRLFARARHFVDEFHFRGHKDHWCKNNTNPHKVDGVQQENHEASRNFYAIHNDRTWNSPLLVLWNIIYCN